LDINDRNSNFAGVDLQIGDANPFTTIEGSGGVGDGLAVSAS
jgi:hypothetical protein